MRNLQQTKNDELETGELNPHRNRDPPTIPTNENLFVSLKRGGPPELVQLSDEIEGLMRRRKRVRERREKMESAMGVEVALWCVLYVWRVDCRRGL
ncbi:hypothetical protein E3N88_10299 [Mikania micrantha]|uniref:Uncharacterized protein n=1 Tax=Mikania micrantha TaxID=192012 RepID=A0A5N6PB86_9ASTR|nr:hypothetical protein E3N88_10299 [Mikania micrantha]